MKSLDQCKDIAVCLTECSLGDGQIDEGESVSECMREWWEGEEGRRVCVCVCVRGRREGECVCVCEGWGE